MKSKLEILKNRLEKVEKQLEKKDKVVRICYDHLDKFTDIYPKDDAPKGMRWENKI